MKRNIKVGDKIKIKPIEWFKKYCSFYDNPLTTTSSYYYLPGDYPSNSVHIIKEMLKLCGRIVTISNIVKNNYYTILEDGGRFAWSDYMFDLNTYRDYDSILEDFCRKQCVVHNCINCELFYSDNSIDVILKVGDLVRVKSMEYFSMYLNADRNTYNIPISISLNNSVSYSVYNREIIDNYCKKVVQIKEVITYDFDFIKYKIVGNDDLNWNISMFDIEKNKYFSDPTVKLFNYCKRCNIENSYCISECLLFNIKNKK